MCRDEEAFLDKLVWQLYDWQRSQQCLSIFSFTGKISFVFYPDTVALVIQISAMSMDRYGLAIGG